MSQQASLQRGAKRRTRTQFSATFSFIRGTDAGEEIVYSAEPYDNMNVEELQQLAKARNLKGFWKFDREKLLALHADYDEAHPRPNARRNPRRRSNQGNQILTNPTEGNPPSSKKGKPNGNPTTEAKDDPVPEPTSPIKPDAGKLVTDLNQIVTKYQTSSDEAYSASQATLDVDNAVRVYLNSFESDSKDRQNVDYYADNAKNSIRRTKDQRDAESAHQAEMKRRSELAAVVANTPPDPPGNGGGDGGGGHRNDRDRDDRNDRRGSNVPAIVGGILGALLLLILGAAFITWLATRDDGDDDNDSVPATVNVNSSAELNAQANRCPSDVISTCQKVLADYNEGEIDLNKAVAEISRAISMSSAPPPAANPPQSSSSGGFVNLQDGRSESPRSALNYEDTGVGLSKTWALTVPKDHVILIFGVTLNDHTNKIASNKGFGISYGPGDLNFTVVDGMYKIVPRDQAAGEWCMRIKQHRDNGWLLTDIRWAAGGEEPKCY